jgi:hypothetical protein
MVKLALLAAVVAAALYGVREERVLEDAGLLGSCDVVQTRAPAEGQWLACRNGRITEAPDLTRDACVRAGMRAEVEYWRCPATLIASRSADSAGATRSP